MLLGRLGLETARIPHADRHGLVYLDRGSLRVSNGTLEFSAAGSPALKPGIYAIPFQGISMILLGPGSTVSHDALRLMARHGTGLVAIGEDGIRLYTAPPLVSRDSSLARIHARAWADADGVRLEIARRLFALRFGEIVRHRDLNVLRGVEGARMKEAYRLVADQIGVPWKARRYDRANPDAADIPNQAINHAASAVEAAAAIAVSATGTIPQLGFIHEDSANAFILDIADIFRVEITIPLAFAAAREHLANPIHPIEREVRRRAGRLFRDKQIIPNMIDRIKRLFDADDHRRDA